MEGVIRPALLLMTGRMLGYAACFLIPLVLVRVFDQDVFGTYKQLFLIFGSLYAIAQFGISESLYYFIPERRMRAASYVCNAVILLVVIGGILAVALWGFSDAVATALNNSMLAATLPWIGVYTWFMLMASVLEIALTAKKRHALASSAYAISDTARAIACIVPVVMFAELEWLLVSVVGIAITRFAFTLYYAQKEFGSAFRPRMDLLGRQLAYAAPFGLAIVVEVVQAQFHLYFVSYKTNAATFAVYAIACLNIPIVDYLATSAGNVLMVRMKELVRDQQTLITVWRDTIRKLSILIFPLVGVLLVSADQFIVVLFTNQYEEAVPIFMVWVLGMAFSILPVDAALRVFAQTRALLVINLIRLAFVIGLIVPAFQWIGLIGPVAVTVVGILLGKLIGIVQISKVVEVRPLELMPIRSVARVMMIAAVAMIPAIVVAHNVTASPLVLLVISASVYLIGYMFVLIRSGELEATERAALSHWLKLPVRTFGN
jgi:O-antigen/teichoic acid export membrane protein